MTTVKGENGSRGKALRLVVSPVFVQSWRYGRGDAPED